MLVKLPKEVGKIMSALQTTGFEAYVVGECVRNSMLGKNPFGWDVSTNASLEDLKKLFPDGEILSERLGVIRLEYIEELLDKDKNVIGEKGIIVDVAPYRNRGVNSNTLLPENLIVNTIEEDLAGRDFTINAIADGQINIVDAFNGRDDMRNKIIKTVADADLSLKAEPMRMLRAIRLAAELDFDLEKNLYDAIINNGHLLDGAKISKIRDEFVALVTGVNAGKGLRLLIETGLISVILTQDIVNKLTKREWQDLATLSENIDKTQPVEARRLGLFFTCIDKRKARPAIERLDFDEKTKRHLLDAVQDMPKLYFISTKPVLKKFIYERGWERYEYLANMEKAQRIVFEYFSEHKIQIKMFLLDEIKRLREPIFPNELKIDANDLIEAGICTRENAEKVLGQITEEIHTHPEKNTRKELMKLAKIYSKNKLRAAFRGIHWER